ncbi:hypothetical protein N7534_004945 [Penicillium rubens]|nr:hypothetical protein N7534_004945 [Penicillium rubens]
MPPPSRSPWNEDPIKPVLNGSKSALDSGTRNPFTIRSRSSSRDITPSNNHSPSDRKDSFRDGIRQSDGKCLISGTLFSPDKENLWIECDSKINSIQNGLLMDAALHILFDQYFFSINPDVRILRLPPSQDGYEIVTFLPNHWQIDGRGLGPVCRRPNDPNHVTDDFLRWHFRQSVLANMRGAGEPIFETDFKFSWDGQDGDVAK